MKKGLILLTSLVLTGTAVAPVLQQNNTQEIVTPLFLVRDNVDLTLPENEDSKTVELKNLKRGLNEIFLVDEVVGVSESAATIKYANNNQQELIWSNDEDVNILLEGILEHNGFITKAELNISLIDNKANNVVISWTQDDSEEILSAVIGELDWEIMGVNPADFFTNDIEFKYYLWMKLK
ncbi:hypothetical protein [Spiroplasma platyhelix]|uniref:Uncharacterized protein n=1 Tax=Spiroplasma platyhelix PALS-1 TaxID=1276218 RepID=A0A846UDW1_9MOLU|nr:hypothetical protein [Spiroplasma platyhelix]MBE4704306.1 hypothetical protein [Spiroplasma platyhelix PALS-1]NKE38678.1 hypothetical protein [Spiroplasma platyhelix PALS-1]UJB28890.1 hypothetical protein SPLAT_v1c01230 [Spiroplasma platyhelix PALS-1]